MDVETGGTGAVANPDGLVGSWSRRIRSPRRAFDLVPAVPLGIHLGLAPFSMGRGQGVLPAIAGPATGRAMAAPTRATPLSRPSNPPPPDSPIAALRVAASSAI